MSLDLQFYRSKTTRIRGETFQDKLKTIIDRCLKVHKDCKSAFNEGRDLTQYRQDFGKEHQICYDLIDAAETKEEALAIVDILRVVGDESDSTGQREALGYIITEIEIAIETSV